LKVRELATKKNIVLIFDECTSGFRETYGGIYKKFNVEPDLAMYGKTLGNGYAITAVVGKREIMEFAQKTFISSTFWTERIGPSAGLKTLDIMKKEKSWEVITKIGKQVQKKWREIANKHDLKIEINGIPALSTFSFNYSNAAEFKTFLTQEFLKKGFLGSTSFYASLVHTDKILNKYFEVLDEIFFEVSNCVLDKKTIKDLLKSPTAHSGFKRLN
jgi:glutamate-1-semialdehyde aminotransferase